MIKKLQSSLTWRIKNLSDLMGWTSVIKTGKINLSYKDCLGTWEENVKNFQEGMTVKGIVRDTEKNKNGVFIEITPNLVGMTEYNENLQYGQSVDVCIKKIQPEKKKLKLTII